MADNTAIEPALRVSDHALVRFIERIKGVSLDPYRAELLALAAAHRDEQPPSGVFDDGLVLIVELLGHPVITTVLGPGQRPKRKQQPYGTGLIHVPAQGGDAPSAGRPMMREVEAAVIPGYWMNETSGVLRPAIEAYLAGGPLAAEHVGAMRAYLRQWIFATAWLGPRGRPAAAPDRPIAQPRGHRRLAR